VLYFEWDPLKADANLDKHGVDFLDAIGIFEGSHFTYRSRQRASRDS